MKIDTESTVDKSIVWHISSSHKTATDVLCHCDNPRTSSLCCDKCHTQSRCGRCGSVLRCICGAKTVDRCPCVVSAK